MYANWIQNDDGFFVVWHSDFQFHAYVHSCVRVWVWLLFSISPWYWLYTIFCCRKLPLRSIDSLFEFVFFFEHFGFIKKLERDGSLNCKNENAQFHKIVNSCTMRIYVACSMTFKLNYNDIYERKRAKITLTDGE